VNLYNFSNKIFTYYKLCFLKKTINNSGYNFVKLNKLFLFKLYNNNNNNNNNKNDNMRGNFLSRSKKMMLFNF